MSWIKYLFHWDRRPRIPAHLVTPFAFADVSRDELIVFKAGRARDRQYIERLMYRTKARNALDLLARLPKPKRPSVQKRIAALIQRWEGSLPYDPTLREYRAMRADAKPPDNGIRRLRMKIDYWR